MMAISSRLDLHLTDYDAEIHSPTGSSEDSVEVKIEPICLNRNKRKLNEPKKTPDSILTTGPLKKRVCFKVKNEKDNNTVHPFRPWSPPPASLPPPKGQITNLLQPIQDQPVALIKKPLDGDHRIRREIKNLNISALPPPPQLRVPVHPSLGTLGNFLETDRILLKTNETFPSLQVPTTTTTSAPLLTPPSTSTKSSTSSSSSSIRDGNHHLLPQQHHQQQQQREQRNYKNMTRERRIEANARERTRVHTISAAFDTLRRSIPSYSHNQKLSKLSVLRIACSYIRTLSSIINSDDNSTAECVELVTKTIQKEGKLRKKKDEGD